MKVIDTTPRQVEGRPEFWVLGIVKDNDRFFVYLRQHGVLLEDGTGKPLLGLNDKQAIGFKDYIEETKAEFDLNNNKISLDLYYIDDENYVRQLQKFIYDNIIWKELLERNKRAIDEKLKKGEKL